MQPHVQRQRQWPSKFPRGLPCSWRQHHKCVQRQHQWQSKFPRCLPLYKAPAPAVCAAPAPVAEYISRGVAPAAAALAAPAPVAEYSRCTLPTCPWRLLQPCVQPEKLQYVVRFLPETSRRHTFYLLLRAAETLRRHLSQTAVAGNRGRCGVTIANCCCGSREVQSRSALSSNSDS